jgi:hypothetical protein
MLKGEDCRTVFPRKIDNAMAHRVSRRIVDFANLCPQRRIILFAFSNDPRLTTLTCNPSKQFLPKAV